MSFINVSKATHDTCYPQPSPSMPSTRFLTFVGVNYSASERLTQPLSLRLIPQPLMAAVAVIPLQSAGQVDLPLCVIRFHRRVPTQSKHSHACPHSTALPYLRRNFLPKGFGHLSSQLMRIARGVSLYTNCVSDRASWARPLTSMIFLERALVNGDWTRTFSAALRKLAYS